MTNIGFKYKDEKLTLLPKGAEVSPHLSVLWYHISHFTSIMDWFSSKSTEFVEPPSWKTPKRTSKPILIFPRHVKGLDQDTSQSEANLQHLKARWRERALADRGERAQERGRPWHQGMATGAAGEKVWVWGVTCRIWGSCKVGKERTVDPSANLLARAHEWQRFLQLLTREKNEDTVAYFFIKLFVFLERAVLCFRLCHSQCLSVGPCGGSGKGIPPVEACVGGAGGAGREVSQNARWALGGWGCHLQTSQMIQKFFPCTLQALCHIPRSYKKLLLFQSPLLAATISTIKWAPSVSTSWHLCQSLST